MRIRLEIRGSQGKWKPYEKDWPSELPIPQIGSKIKVELSDVDGVKRVIWASVIGISYIITFTPPIVVISAQVRQ